MAALGAGSRHSLVIDPAKLFRYFPHLARDGYRITSPATLRYNCIAWAVSIDDRAWWPAADHDWPTSVPKERTIAAFVAAFATRGYEPCDGGNLEANFEKVVLYVDAYGRPTHAARQLSTGKWTSKLGPQVDIEHATPEALSGKEYGDPVLYLRRAVRISIGR